MTGAMRRTPAIAVAAARPPIIAPLTPQDMMSCPVSHSPGTFVRGLSQRWRIRDGSWSRPYSSPRSQPQNHFIDNGVETSQ